MLKLTSTLLLLLAICFATVSYASSIDHAVALLKAGDSKQAIKLFKSHKNTFQAKLHLAKIYLHTDLDESQEWIEQAIEQQPDAALAHYWRGRIMGAQAQNSIFSALSYAGKSLQGFTKAVELEPDSVRYRNALMQFHVQAPSIAGGDLDIAKQQLEKIKQLDPIKGAKAEIDLAYAQDNKQKVEKLLNDAKQNFADLPDFYFIAGLHAQRAENYSDAFAAFSSAIQKQAETPDSIKAKYNALYQMGKTAVLSKDNIAIGIASLQTYLQQAPELDEMSPKPWAEFRLANLLALNAQKTEAKTIYLKLMQSNDEDLAKQAKKAAKKI